MKQIVKLFVLLLVLTMALAGCSSGGGGSVPSSSSSTLTKTAVLSGGAADIDVPFGNNGGNGLRVMMLYRAAEMKGAGPIKTISFMYNQTLTSPFSCPNTTIKMSHTNLANLTGTLNSGGTGIFANNIDTGQGSQQTVLNSSTVSISPGTAGTWYTITLDTPFYYNGVDNLVVDISRDACTCENPAIPTLWTQDHYDTAASNLNIIEAGGAASTAGTPENWRPDTKFNLSGGESSILYTVANYNALPFGSVQKIQLLYKAGEINGSGTITGIGFPVSGPSGGVTGASSATTTVTLGHTSLTGLTTTYANNFNIGTPVVVANAQTFTVPAGVPYGTYVWIPIPDGTFIYDGTDNLVVQIETTAVTNALGVWWLDSNHGTNTRVFGNPGDTVGSGTDGSQYLIKFRFAGGTVDVITAGTTTEDFPFSSAFNNKRQYLYFAEELGTKGSITKVACRLIGNSNASDYDSLTVVLGHTTSTTVSSTTFSSSMADAQTVFSGTFTVPAGLGAGDWIEIPLSTPFAYDGKRNLVVQMSSLKGSATNALVLTQDNTLYLNRRNYADDNTTDTVAGTDNFLGDLRLFMQ